jgi:hypothetical protein
LTKPLADGEFIPGVHADGNPSELDRVYAAPYLAAGLIKEFVKSAPKESVATEAPRTEKVASDTKE